MMEARCHLADHVNQAARRRVQLGAVEPDGCKQIVSDRYHIDVVNGYLRLVSSLVVRLNVGNDEAASVAGGTKMNTE